MSQEDEDLLQQSVKKSKYDGIGINFTMGEHVPETPLSFTNVNQQQMPMEGNGETFGMQLDQQPRASYKATLAGMNDPEQIGSHNQSFRSGDYPDSNDDVYDKEEDKECCPLICLTKEEKKILRDRWRQSLIIKLWGRKIGYNFLQKKLQNMWRPKAFMDLVALENDYYLVRFYSKEDFEFARDQGPWSILDHYLVVKEWSPDFDPITDKTEKLIVWVRIPCLPIEYFDYAFLKKVGEKIGKPIRADHNTGMAARGRFARICVEVDITKPLLTMFKLKRRVRRIEYEGLHLVCFECGIVGHRKEECAKVTPEFDHPVEQLAGESEGTTINGETFVRKVQSRKETTNEEIGGAAFGPWMIAQKKGNQYGKPRHGRYGSGENQESKEGKESDNGKIKKNPNGVEIKSRFNALYDLMEEENIEENTEKTEVGVEPNIKNKEAQRQGRNIRRSPIVARAQSRI